MRRIVVVSIIGIDKFEGGYNAAKVAQEPEMRTQLVAARVIAETLADAAEEPEIQNGRITEVAGPQEERLADIARALRQPR